MMTPMATEIPATAPIWSDTLSIMALTQPWSKYIQVESVLYMYRVH